MYKCFAINEGDLLRPVARTHILPYFTIFYHILPSKDIYIAVFS